MSILQFLRIFWARWLTIAIITVSAALGAYVAAHLVQPRYVATARVMLSVGKPDPITGSIINAAAARSYSDIQKELVNDDRVAGKVAERLHWNTDPNLIRAYQARGAGDDRDFPRWLAGRVKDQVDVSFKGTIMLIDYHANSPVEAKIAAETLRTAYLEQSLADRREEAAKFADLFSKRADTARAAAEEAESAKAAYEKETGIVLSDNNLDPDTARMNALAGQLGAMTVAPAAASASQASLALADLEGRMAQASRELGPNHPRMIEMQRRHDELVQLAKQEQANSNGGSAVAAAIGNALQQQKARVIGQREQVERLRQLQSNVDLKRDEYKRTAARAADLALEANMAESVATPLGVVLAPTSPEFPKKGLMVGGATVLGFALGMAIALLIELLNRRVRGIEDLEVARDVRCIGVLSEPGSRRNFGGSGGLSGIFGRKRLGATA